MLPTVNCLQFPGLELKHPSHSMSVTGALPATAFPAALRLLRTLLQPWEAALLQTPLCTRVWGHGEPHMVVAEDLSAQKERKASPGVQPWAGTRFVLVPNEGEASGTHPCVQDGTELPLSLSPSLIPEPISPPKSKAHGELPHPADPGTPRSPAPIKRNPWTPLIPSLLNFVWS